MRRFVMALSLAVTALLPATGRVWAQSGENDVEEIFVARTVRHGRVVPSDFCSIASL